MSLIKHLEESISHSYPLENPHTIQVTQNGEAYTATITHTDSSEQTTWNISPAYVQACQQRLAAEEIQVDMVEATDNLGTAPTDHPPTLKRHEVAVIKRYGAGSAKERLQEILKEHGEVVSRNKLDVFPHEFELKFSRSSGDANFVNATWLAVQIIKEGYGNDEVLDIHVKSAGDLIKSDGDDYDATTYLALPPRFVNAMLVHGLKPRKAEAAPIPVPVTEQMTVTIEKPVVTTASKPATPVAIQIVTVGGLYQAGDTVKAKPTEIHDVTVKNDGQPETEMTYLLREAEEKEVPTPLCSCTLL